MTPPVEPVPARAWRGRVTAGGSGGRELVAVVLAVGLVLAVNFLMFAVLYDALRSESPGLSENATQVITTAFGGIIGVLGSYIGYRAGSDQAGARGVTGPGVEVSGPEPEDPVG